MVEREEIVNVLDNVINQHFTGKCKPGYVSPKTRMGKFLDSEYKNFHFEEYSDDQDPNNENDPDYEYSFVSPVGRIQQIQEDLQAKVGYSSIDVSIAQTWNVDGFIAMNDYLYQKDDWEDNVYYRTIDGYDYNDPKLRNYIDFDNNNKSVSLSIPQICDKFSDVIKKSPRVQEDCVTLRWGRFDDSLNVGDISKFDGFTSASFNPYVATHSIREEGAGWMSNNRKLIRIWTPKGTKGVVMDKTLGTPDWQSELVYDKGQKFIVVQKTGFIVDILLYD